LIVGKVEARFGSPFAFEVWAMCSALKERCERLAQIEKRLVPAALTK
jgi:hypothetical protein